MLLEPPKHENLIDFDAYKLHKDNLVDLDTIWITILEQFSAEADLILNADDNGITKYKRQVLLQCLAKDLFLLSSSFEQVCLKLLAPVFDEVDTALLS